MARRTCPINLRPRGFTLAEALIASVVLAVAVVGISATVNASYRNASGNEDHARALMLAEQLMEEIASRPLSLPAGATNANGWSGGNPNRATYDTVDDYNGYTDTTAALRTLAGTSVATDADGTPMTRSVVVQSGARPSGHSLAPAADLLLVTVTVTPEGGQPVSLSRLMTNVSRLR